MATPSVAANAYQMAARLARQAEAETPTSSVDFGGLVREAVNSVVEKGRETDQKTIGLVQGKADVVDVVTAIAETEVALETMVSVRDRVISAYEEIMRMPI
ncbi:flagellar hook-basal body complex protein FliE [Polymorphum gilvum]|uniref:Flagellar hook-basal body complex protein FliE n=1 Tax=Polymorphum gilvum (strain LMG 25793 / CGMCC 1.9160 / SL003B-26A1) TaxID=991905 RepID=F2J450_POLGS|nr:flagellar hook-basal body complex protein FliE [Polymorphum gilvum]ADZ69976.1 Flagellar hook-basal body protein FliE [Polymorphum gilvum SL003B-26A1]